jgi:hypothetical protein
MVSGDGARPRTADTAFTRARPAAKAAGSLSVIWHDTLTGAVSVTEADETLLPR